MNNLTKISNKMTKNSSFLCVFTGFQRQFHEMPLIDIYLLFFGTMDR